MSGVRAVLVLFATCIALVMSGPTHAQQSGVGAALLRFEAALSWNAVSAEWRGIRPGWVQAAAGATSADDLAELLLVLESNMGWNSVSAEWRGRRPSWVQEVNGVSSEGEVALLLIDLEGNTLWSAVDANWRGVRPGWIAGLQRLASAAPTPPPAAAPPPAPVTPPAWIADRRTGCRAWNTQPVPRQTAQWNGTCQNQMAQGPGVLQLFVDGQPTDRIEGNFTNGKLNGRGLIIHGAGGRTEGEFQDGELHGRGIITAPDGSRVDGTFRNGERIN